MKCKFESCNKQRRSGKSEWCNGHYQQLNSGKPLKELQNKNLWAECQFEGCHNNHFCKSYCVNHYAKFKNGTLHNDNKKVHILTNMDIKSMTADCAKCGPTTLKYTKYKTYICNTKYDRMLSGRKHRHGLTNAEMVKMKEGKACAICGSREKLVIDHCHDSMRIRGVLCHWCNVAIGYFYNDVKRMQRAIIYLSQDVDSG